MEFVVPTWAGPTTVVGVVVLIAFLVYRGVLWTGPAVKQMKEQYEASIVRIREDANNRADEAKMRENEWREAYLLSQKALVEANEAVAALTEVGHTANDLIKALRRTVEADPR